VPWSSWHPRTSHDAADLDRRVAHVSIIDPHHPLFGNRLRLGERISYRGSLMVVVVLPDGRERSVRRSATDLAEAPIPLLKADPEGPSLIIHAAVRHSLRHIKLLSVTLQHTDKQGEKRG
jgi:hypothetical protein